MAIITTGSFAKDLWPGVARWYGMKYKEYPVEHLEIFDKLTSDQAFEEDVQATGFGLATIKTEGASISFDETQQGFIQRYTHVTYGLGFIITREMHDDGVSMTVALRRATALAFSMRQTKETVAANVLNRAFNDSYTFADGLELCSTAHLNTTGGTWRNELSTAADISEDALEQCCIDIADFQTDRGLKIAIRPKKLIVPPELEFEAARLLKTPQQPGTANNDINAIRVTGKFPDGYAVNNYLDDSDAFFIKTDCPMGLTHYERRADDFDTDNDFDTENARFKSTFRGSWGCTDPRGVMGSPGA